MEETLNIIKTQFEQCQAQSADLYQVLNALRDWFDKNVVNYEVYLEDNWFEDKTTIEYTLRCLDTLNTLVIAEDEYQNNRDNNVWNLGKYVKTYWTVEEPWAAIEQFIRENPLPRLQG